MLTHKILGLDVGSKTVGVAISDLWVGLPKDWTL